MDGFTLISGGAPGADSLAAGWARNSPLHSYAQFPADRGDMQAYPGEAPFEFLEFPAKWTADCVPGRCRPGHRRRNEGGEEYCPAAGIYRNERMLHIGKPTHGLAFIDKDIIDSKGTANMKLQLEGAGIHVWMVRV
jgi:hypothetical protein